LDPTWSAYSNLGNIYFLMKKYPDSVDAFEKAVQLGPNQEMAVGNLADAYRLSGQKDKASAAYDKAIALAYQELQVNPRDTSAMGSLSLYYAKKGDATHSLDFIRRARDIDKKDVTLIYIQATDENLANKHDDALKSLRDALRNGYPLNDAEADPDLANLTSTPEFKQIAKEVQAGSHP
ncbi:MAG: tetratricopeptide repeat protein, partial [Candidatus Dormiibacterota bacterium]